MNAIEMIEELQKKETLYTPEWMVGEQLKEMIAGDEAAQKIVAEDIEADENLLKKIAAALKKMADDLHKKNKASCVCIAPAEAEEVIRNTIGLEKHEAKMPQNDTKCEAEPSGIINLADFF